MRQVRKWQQVQLVYMPGAATPSLPAHERDANEDDAGDLETPEKMPLVLPSGMESIQRDAVCLHNVAEYERQLRLTQLQDSLIELRHVRRIRHTLLMNHRTQIAGQGQRANTRSRAVINSVEERISKFVHRYRAAYNALIRLDPTGEWQRTYLELKDEDNRGPGKEDDEQGPGDGSYTFSWIWLSNPRACDAGGGDGDYGGIASDEEVNDVMRVQWATSRARMERWAEEVELLQEEMRRVVMFLEWKSKDWLARQETRSTTAPPSVQSGLQAYARKQAAIHHDLAASFSMLWYPTLVAYNLQHSWITDYMKNHGLFPSDTNDQTPQAPGISGAKDLHKADEGSQAGTTSLIQLQDLPNPTADGNIVLLEEVSHIGDDDEDDSDYLEFWDSSNYVDLDGDDGDDDDFGIDLD